MAKAEKIRLTRRDMMKLGAGGAGMFMLGAGGLAVPRGFAGGSGSGSGGGGGGSLYIEAFPTSPLILKPFNDLLNDPDGAARRVDPTTWDSLGGAARPEQAGLHRPPSPNSVLQEQVRRQRWASISCGRAGRHGELRVA